MKSCVFCQALQGKVEASVVYSDETCAAFMDIQPVNPGHVLVIPKIHARPAVRSDSSADPPATGLHQLKPGMEKMISALQRGSLRFNEWVAESKLSRRFVSEYRQELLRRGIVQYDPILRKYSVTQKGKESFWALSTSEFLRLHPPRVFSLSLGIEGPPVEGISVGPMEVDFALSVSLSHDRPIKHLAEIFRRRMADAPKVVLRDILTVAVEKGLLPKPHSGRLNIRRIPKRKWKEIFKKLCPKGHELVYVEHIDLRGLQRYVTHPRRHESMGLSVDVTAKPQKGG